MECYTVDNGYEEECPVRSTFCLGNITIIVYGEEDMGGETKVWESGTELNGVVLHS